MLIPCPCCGLRDRREFTYYGHETYLNRPKAEAPPAAWHAYLHLRDNPAGRTRDLWYHDPCGTWVLVERDTLTHALYGACAVSEAAGRRA